MIAIVNFTGERNPFPIRRPTRLIVGFVMIRNLRQRPAAIGIDGPDIGVAILVIFLAGAVRNEGDALSIRRPLRIAVIPIVAFGDLFGVAGLYINDRQMCAPIIEPTSVIEFVRAIPVMTHVATIAALGAAIARTYATDDHQTSPL